MPGKPKRQTNSKPNRRPKGKKQPIAPIRKRKLEIKFDPEARKEYLTGFQKRKKERRTFGLAMQKLKDRRNRLDERKDQRVAEKDLMEEIELQKKAQRGDDEDDDEEEEEGVASDNEKEESDEIVTYNRNDVAKSGDDANEERKAIFFGVDEHSEVTVTTHFGMPENDDSENEYEEEMRKQAEKKGVDKEQRWAGNVAHFMGELKGNLPGKKKNSSVKRKGKHGAGAMSGMGGAKALNAAKKILQRTESRVSRDDGGKHKKGGKSKKRGKR